MPRLSLPNSKAFEMSRENLSKATGDLISSADNFLKGQGTIDAFDEAAKAYEEAVRVERLRADNLTGSERGKVYEYLRSCKRETNNWKAKVDRIRGVPAPQIVNLTRETFTLASPECIEASGCPFDPFGYCLKRGMKLLVAGTIPPKLLPNPRDLSDIRVANEGRVISIPTFPIYPPHPTEGILYLVPEGVFMTANRQDFITPGSPVYNAMGEVIAYANIRTMA